MRKELFDQMTELKEDLIDTCLVCHGVGFNGDDLCECRIIQRYLNVLIESKIPTEYWELDLDSLTEVKPPQIISAVKLYIDKLKNATQKSLGMLFMGPNGRGKTSIQCAIGKSAIVKGYAVQYFTAQQYVEAVKGKDQALLQEYESGKILLLDELDKVYVAKGSNFVTKTLEEFFRRMISNRVAFIICTNFDESGLIDMFGDSTVSLLLGHLRFLTMAGKDYRKTYQSSDWLTRLGHDIDYHNPHIVEFSNALYTREMQEDTIGWEKKY